MRPVIYSIILSLLLGLLTLVKAEEKDDGCDNCVITGTVTLDEKGNPGTVIIGTEKK
jgi:hypothetical protein